MISLLNQTQVAVTELPNCRTVGFYVEDSGQFFLRPGSHAHQFEQLWLILYPNTKLTPLNLDPFLTENELKHISVIPHSYVPLYLHVTTDWQALRNLCHYPAINRYLADLQISEEKGQVAYTTVWGTGYRVQRLIYSPNQAVFIQQRACLANQGFRPGKIRAYKTPDGVAFITLFDQTDKANALLLTSDSARFHSDHTRYKPVMRLASYQAFANQAEQKWHLAIWRKNCTV